MQAMPLLLLSMLTAAIAPAAELFIAHPSVKTTSLTTAETKAFFSGSRTVWPDKSAAVIALASAGPGQEALMAFLGKSRSQFQMVWKKRVFTGSGLMPTSLPDDQAVASFVAKTPGALALVSLDAAPAGVIVIAVE